MMRTKTTRADKKKTRRLFAELCRGFGAKLISCNLADCRMDEKQMAADLHKCIQHLRRQNADVGAILCPNCGDVVLSFELVN